MMFVRAFVVWLVLMGAEVLHGVARTLLLEPLVGDFRARQIGVFTGSVIVFAIALAFVRWLRPTAARQLAGVGLFWLVLTIGFEIALGRFAMGYSWSRLAADYNLFAGGLLPLGLLVMTLSPWLAGRLREVV